MGNQQVFTTIRKWDESKEAYYKKAIGEIFELVLNDIKVGEAKLINVNVQLFDMLNVPLLQVDTGILESDKIIKLFNSFGCKFGGNVIVLLFQKVVRNSGIADGPSWKPFSD
jgi:uncharacterized membrane protein